MANFTAIFYQEDQCALALGRFKQPTRKRENSDQASSEWVAETQQSL